MHLSSLKDVTRMFPVVSVNQKSLSDSTCGALAALAKTVVDPLPQDVLLAAVTTISPSAMLTK